MRTYRTDPRPTGSAFPLSLLNLMRAPEVFVKPIADGCILCTWCNTYRTLDQFRYRSNGSRQSSVCLVCHQYKTEGKVNAIPKVLRETLLDKCRANGIGYETYRQRILRGWSVERSLTTPAKKTGRPPKIKE